VSEVDSVSDSAGCPSETETVSGEIDASVLDGLLGDDGSIDAAHCEQLCADFDYQGWAERCTLTESAMLIGSADTGMNETSDGPTGGGSTDTDDATDGIPSATDGDRVTLECTIRPYCIGRGHQSLRSWPRTDGEDRVAAWLAASAHSEAASVVSFLALREELRAHGAPEDLVARAQRAALDEVRHARVMTCLARSRGRTPMQPRFDRIEVRDLETIAVENAVEGCVRETWAALEACHQAQHAVDPDVRRAMTDIAADETRHAELAHDLDAWLAERLDEASRRRVAIARERAISQLEDGSWGDRRDDLCRSTGLPDRNTTLRLLEGLRKTIWA
jgi:hypothetical protein